MYMEDKTFKLIKFRPDGRQYLANHMGMFFFTMGVFCLAGYDDLVTGNLRTALLVVGFILVLYQLWLYLYVKRTRYSVGSEQIIHEYGVLSTQRNYIELYRVVDYEESQSFMQVLLGIKTVTIYSGDRTCPKLDMVGVGENASLIWQIRERVEYNKLKRNIHEFTNTK